MHAKCRTLSHQHQQLLYIPFFKHSAIQRPAHTVYLCVVCGSENNQRLFPYTSLTDWFL
jgi:hypothetical protein